MQRLPVTHEEINKCNIDRLAVGVWGLSTNSSITMGAPGVNGGRVFPATLTNELVEPVAEVLHLARSQDATHSHQLGVVGVVVATSRSRVGVATSSQRSPLDR